MILLADEPDHSRPLTQRTTEHLAAPSAPAGDLLSSDLPGVATPALLGDPRLAQRGNRPLQIALLQRMQQSHGNRATRTFLQRQATLAAAPAATAPSSALPAAPHAVAVQREPAPPTVAPAPPTLDLTPLQRATTPGQLTNAVTLLLDGINIWLQTGRTVSDETAVGIGQATGQVLWDYARQEVTAGRDFGDQAHFDLLYKIRALIQHKAPAGAPGAAVFGKIEDAFNLAARGATSVDFTRNTKPAPIRILLTGFDPFLGTWNPSGAAALQLDGYTTTRHDGVQVAVETVVLPVSFDEFNAGIVERIVGPLAKDVAAVITVSLDPNHSYKDAKNRPNSVQFEQYTIGTHYDSGGSTATPTREIAPGIKDHLPVGQQAVSAAPNGGSLAPLIIKTPAPVATLAQQTAGTRDGVTIPPAVLGTAVTLEFATDQQAGAVLTALGLDPHQAGEVAHKGGKTLVIGSADPRRTPSSAAAVAALDRILANMKPDSTEPTGIIITLPVGSKPQAFQAKVLAGPGGAYLSNEVSYRTLRLLNAVGSAAPTFHVHTPALSTEINYGDKRQNAAPAKEALAILVATLKNVIEAVAAQVPQPPGPAQPATAPTKPP